MLVNGIPYDMKTGMKTGALHAALFSIHWTLCVVISILQPYSRCLAS